VFFEEDASLGRADERKRVLPPVALLYDDSAYVEKDRVGGTGAGDAPVGLMGRQVAGREFLGAYLTHGAANDVTAGVCHRAAGESLSPLCSRHPRRASC
jgi:hypothetical protein